MRPGKWWSQFTTLENSFTVNAYLSNQGRTQTASKNYHPSGTPRDVRPQQKWIDDLDAHLDPSIPIPPKYIPSK